MIKLKSYAIKTTHLSWLFCMTIEFSELKPICCGTLKLHTGKKATVSIP